jgi:predicted extracellular nuclease
MTVEKRQCHDAQQPLQMCTGGKNLLFVFIFFVIFLQITYAQVSHQEFRVMFYNVENLFDTEDDPNTDDDEFTPRGARRWTPRRYYAHLQQTARVINAVGEWDTPALIGLCEVENDSVMIHLISRTPLRSQNYRYCITRGIDPRGIETALLYQRDKFQYINHQSKRIRFTQPDRRSRDILHVWGRTITGDTLDVFVCHFPSRSGGEKETEQARLDAAKSLRQLCDSLYDVRLTPNIHIMGDFNDNPSDKSIQVILNSSDSKRNMLHLFADPKLLNFEGSYKYQGEWSQLDQMMVSQSWAVYLKKGSPRNFNAPFLLTNDKTWRGMRPLRIYYGFRYEGGFSDHLPIVADFLIPLIKK